MMECILRHYEEHGGQPLRQRDVRNAAHEVTRPIFFGMAIIITAYLPLFMFQRIEYKLFSPMAWAIGFALLGALLVCLTVIPGLAYEVFRKPGRVRHNRTLDRVSDVYLRWMDRIVGRTQLTITAFVFAVAAVGLLGATIGRDFLPYLDEGSIWLQVTLPPAISLDKASAMSADLRRAAMEFQEVANIVTQVGRNDDGTDPWTPSHIESAVTLHPYDTWESGISKHELIARMTERFDQIPGMDVGFSQPMIDGVLDKLAGAHSDLVVKVYGNDFAESRRIAEGIVTALKTVVGAQDVVIDQEPPLPQVRIEIDRAACARYGVNAADVADMINTGIGGKPAAQVFVEERHYDVGVRATPSTRSSPEAIGNLQVTSSTGVRIALAQVARVSLETGESTITREMGRRHLTVRLNVRGRDLASLLDESKRKIDEAVQFDHTRFQLSWGGQFENQQRAQARLAVIMPVVIAIMFILLFATFRNAHQPLMILLAVPLGALGGLIALHLRGMTLNVSSAVGFIALFGVAVMDGILMVSRFNRFRVEDGLPLKKAVMAGVRLRFRPVLITASVATLGLLPAALQFGLGSDVQRPLATVVVGGLITATGLTLVWLPALYYVIEHGYEERVRRLVAAKAAPAAEPAPAAPPPDAAPASEGEGGSP
jgi:cobalt-zinc-cadmium resistance protein CzcA